MGGGPKYRLANALKALYNKIKINILATLAYLESDSLKSLSLPEMWILKTASRLLKVARLQSELLSQMLFCCVTNFLTKNAA